MIEDILTHYRPQPTPAPYPFLELKDERPVEPLQAMRRLFSQLHAKLYTLQGRGTNDGVFTPSSAEMIKSYLDPFFARQEIDMVGVRDVCAADHTIPDYANDDIVIALFFAVKQKSKPYLVTREEYPNRDYQETISGVSWCRSGE